MIAVLITYHNEGRLLTECLHSLAGQLDAVSEIRVFDDASTDPAEHHIPRELDVHVIRSAENLGPGRGRNRLLAAARSEYVHFHDADDLFAPDWAARVQEAIKTTHADVVFTDISFFDERSRCVTTNLLHAAAFGPSVDLVQFAIRNSFLPACGCYRRMVVERVGGYRESLWQAEDWDFHVRLAVSGVSFSYVDAPLVHCRSRPDSRSRNRTEVFSSAIDAAELLEHELPVQYLPDLAERVAQFGLILFRAGVTDQARRAFRLAERIGPPAFEEQRPLYRLSGRLFGQERTEIAAAWYRRRLSGLLARTTVKHTAKDAL